MMNNYNEYYNYVNNMNYQQKNVNNSKFENDPYVAFIRGNLFNNLYNPYKNYIPAEINPSNEKEYALLLVQIYDFICLDLGLYLDTHPNDSNAIKLREQYNNQYKQALAQYESMYGPINLSSDTLGAVPWSWDKKNWPWEGDE